jgi:hypothetical protein
VDATAESGLGPLTGRWTGVATGDVDGDGDTDVVMANLGLNTRYRASWTEPFVVFAGDVNGDGGVDVIETEWDSGQLYPVRGAADLGRQMPFFGERFETFLAFAHAPVETVFGADRLAERAVRYEARTLEHALLRNDGSGAFTPEPLPPEAQLTAAYGLVLQDLDGDGHPDVYIVGNFGGADVENGGPYEGSVGVLLRGDGTGGFHAVPVAESGLGVPADGKGLAVADYDGDAWPDVAVGVNDGRLRLFRNRGVAGRGGLAVRLAGSDGNPTGIGARVTVTDSSGRVSTREVQAGGSFLSQSSPRLVFGLADAAGPASVSVRWPDGTESDPIEGLPGTEVTVVEP